MPSIPVPCTNCLRFHYGICYEAPKQCRECGRDNHIERYCPHKRRVQRARGEPWPGTRRWCEMYGLDDDPELKQKVLTAIKTSPGCAIWVNNECIYKGNESHFTTDDRSRGRPLDERTSRRRSRSPARDRVSRRSRSPFRRYSPDYGRLSPIYDNFRDRSPVRRSPQYRRQARSPRYARGSSAVVFEARLESRGGDNGRPRRPPPVYTQSHAGPAVPRYRSGAPLSSFKPAEDRQPLGDLSNTQRPAKQEIGSSQPMQAPVESTSGSRYNEPTEENAGRTMINAPMREPTPMKPFIEDPEFVLGVTKGASEIEICDAYQQRMYELEAERMTDPSYAIRADGSNVFDESIKILNAAKRQLVGY